LQSSRLVLLERIKSRLERIQFVVTASNLYNRLPHLCLVRVTAREPTIILDGGIHTRIDWLLGWMHHILGILGRHLRILGWLLRRLHRHLRLLHLLRRGLVLGLWHLLLLVHWLLLGFRVAGSAHTTWTWWHIRVNIGMHTSI
jgi:hypothetical protein